MNKLFLVVELPFLWEGGGGAVEGLEKEINIFSDKIKLYRSRAVYL